MASPLALLGGKKTREKPFPPHPIIGEEEKKAVMQVMDSGKLSTFIASPGEHFLGGVKIKQLERDFADYHEVKYGVAFNSGTSALHAAVVACGVKAGEEVIVPPYTFTSTATCCLMNNSIPVFADIDPDIYCLDPVRLEKAITPRTRAAIPVHLFGGAADMDGIMKVARKHKIKIIEDCAQAPGATYKNKYVGTFGDCAIFSLTESKNIMTGEGGILITNDDSIADVARMVRNHGEVILESMTQRTYRSDILGWGYRMTELEAAIGIEQLKKLARLNEQRIELADYLSEGLSKIDGLVPPIVHPYVKHVFFAYPLKYNAKKIGIPRELFIKALNAEGIPFGAGYVKPLYLNPIYHENKHFIFNYFGKEVNYEKGICPVTESLHEEVLISTGIIRPPATLKDMDDIIEAVRKIIDNTDALNNSV